jgi:hypothetical protein
MARSKEALARRAEKRGRSVDEQLSAETTNKTTEAGGATKKPRRIAAAYENALNEPGAWKCGSCGNQNFASRSVCRSVTCNETRPPLLSGSMAVVPPSSRSSQSPTTTSTRRSHRPPTVRHDPETSRTVQWPKGQATRDDIRHNQRLRELYLADGENASLTPEEMERAKILIQRDERKKEKKAKTVTATTPNTVQPLPVSDVNVTQEPTKATSESPSVTSLVDTKLQHKRNKALRKKFTKTGGGKGMSEEEIARYHLLVARDERKRNKREEQRNAAAAAAAAAGLDGVDEKTVLTDKSAESDDNGPMKDTPAQLLPVNTSDDPTIGGPRSAKMKPVRSKEEKKALRKKTKTTYGRANDLSD